MLENNQSNFWMDFAKTIFPAIIGLIGVIIGASITSFIKWFEIKNQRKQEKNKQILAKLEEIHILLSAMIYTIGDFASEVHLLSTDSFRELQVTNKEKIKLWKTETYRTYKDLLFKHLFAPYSQLNSIARFYCPQLNGDLEDLRERIMNVKTHTSKVYEQQKESWELFSEELEKLKDCSIKLQDKIVRLSESYR